MAIGLIQGLLTNRYSLCKIACYLTPFNVLLKTNQKIEYRIVSLQNDF